MALPDRRCRSPSPASAPIEQVDVSFGGGATIVSCETDDNGGCTASFTVPDVGWGIYTVEGTGETSQTSETAQFQVVAPSLWLAQYIGASGTSATAYVSGFAPGEQVILYFNGSQIGQPCVANSSGYCAISFTVPPWGWSAYSVSAYGATSQVWTWAPTTFQIVWPSMYLSQTSGPGGAYVTAYMNGYAPNQTIYLYVNGSFTGTTCQANSYGTCSTSMYIGGYGWGSVQVGAQGTSGSGWAYASYQVVTPSLSVSPTAGAAGQIATGTVTGFAPYEYVSFYFGGSYVGYGCRANSSGDCTFNFWAPSNGYDWYQVSATGNESQATAYAYFELVVPSLSLSQPSGAPGAAVTAYVSGYAQNEWVSIYYNGVATGSGCYTYWQSACDATFYVPANSWGSYQVSAIGQTSLASASSRSRRFRRRYRSRRGRASRARRCRRRSAATPRTSRLTSPLPARPRATCARPTTMATAPPASPFPTFPPTPIAWSARARPARRRHTLRSSCPSH